VHDNKDLFAGEFKEIQPLFIVNLDQSEILLLEPIGALEWSEYSSRFLLVKCPKGEYRSYSPHAPPFEK
jgi:hypothetical protein